LAKSVIANGDNGRVQPHQLEYFIAVAETGSFTAAAQRVGVVQSAVSAAVRQLERQLGVTLLDRYARREDTGRTAVAITAEGQALLPRAREVLAALTAARDAVAGARGEVVGTVLLGTLTFTGPWDLAGLLQRFAADHPGVAVHLRQTVGGSATALADVRSGALDLALVWARAKELPGLRLDEIHREPMVLVCCPDHRLARAAEVSIGELADERFIDYPTGFGNRAIVDAAFTAAGVLRSIRTEVTDFRLARSLVCRGMGVTIVPETAFAGEPGVARIPIAEGLQWGIQLATPTRRRASAAASRLADAVRAGAAGGEPPGER
jgi:DNA-binding transcriptional LysR family regulator